MNCILFIVSQLMLSKIIDVINCNLIFTTQKHDANGGGKREGSMLQNYFTKYCLDVSASLSIPPTAGDGPLSPFGSLSKKNLVTDLYYSPTA